METMAEPGAICPLHHKSVMMCDCRFQHLEARVKFLQYRRKQGLDIRQDAVELLTAAHMVGAPVKL